MRRSRLACSVGVCALRRAPSQLTRASAQVAVTTSCRFSESLMPATAKRVATFTRETSSPVCNAPKPHSERSSLLASSSLRRRQSSFCSLMSPPSSRSSSFPTSPLDVSTCTAGRPEVELVAKVAEARAILARVGAEAGALTGEAVVKREYEVEERGTRV